jgi:hypothetical protein
LLQYFFQTLEEEKNHRKKRKDADKAAIEGAIKRAKARANPDGDNVIIKFELPY